VKEAVDPERGSAKSPPPPPFTGRRGREKPPSLKEWLDAGNGDAKYAPPPASVRSPDGFDRSSEWSLDRGMAVDYIAASAGKPGVKRFGCFGGLGL